MKYGLSDASIEKIYHVFSKYENIDKVILYGSRAKGNFREGSDIDLTMFGEEINIKLLHKIELELDDLLLPYTIDLSIYSMLKNDELKEHIERVGIVFYKKDRDDR
ncbi:MAG: nucleotidyltransferase domain-containing protein [Epsilonproteobacteria bacterium]|nr:MAG: nucleotidyltransferase domain-containing protein [Campylobacterota bacterium]